jgi:hypothetical protein
MIVVREIDGHIPILRELRDGDGGALGRIDDAHGVRMTFCLSSGVGLRK